MKPTVIIVDDDRHLLDGIARALRREPYRVLTAGSAQECVDLLAVTTVDVVVSDLRMPEFGGELLVDYFRDMRPDVIRIVLSGHLTAEIMGGLISRGGVYRCLKKPCSSNELKEVLQRALFDHAREARRWFKSRTGESPPRRMQAASSAQSDDLAPLVRNAVDDVERLNGALRSYSKRLTQLKVKETECKE